MTPLCILHGAELPARLKSDHLSQVSLLQSAAIAMLEIISLSQSHTLNGPAVNPLLLICAGTKLQGKHYKLLTLPSHGNGHQHHSQTPSPGRRSHRKKETRRDVSVISGIPSWSPAPSNDVSQRLHMKNHHHSEFTAHFHRFDFLKL